jgi:glycosyltransferase involved in cell wall biosynthesis
MRILHISTRLILGGSQENTVLSCEEQTRRGHEVHLAFGPIYGPEGSLLERVEGFKTADGRRITTHVAQNLVREVSPWKDARARRELRELIERVKPDIVHTHSSKAGILGRLAAWDQRHLSWGGTFFVRRGADIHDPREHLDDVPAGANMDEYEAVLFDDGKDVGIVHTIHGPPFMPIEGGALKRLKTRMVNHVYTLAERRAARCCHVIVSVADAMTREFLRRGIGRPEQFVTVRSGIEQEPFATALPGESRDEVRRALGLAESDFVVGTVARLAEHKGHDDLLSALADDLRKNANWKLLWVGDGWWRERLLTRARGMGLRVVELDKQTPGARAERGASVVLTGLVPPQRVPGLIRAMDALAHPSVREGLPRTVPQALLAGVCPVAYDVDGTGEACVEMKTGRLVALGDVAKLREAIEWCEAHPEHRRALAEAGKAMCVRQFSVKAMVDGLERAYDMARRECGAESSVQKVGKRE